MIGPGRLIWLRNNRLFPFRYPARHGAADFLPIFGNPYREIFGTVIAPGDDHEYHR